MNRERLDVVIERISTIQTEFAGLKEQVDSGEANEESVARADTLLEEYGTLDLEAKSIELRLERTANLASHSHEVNHEGVEAPTSGDESGHVERTRNIERIYNIERTSQTTPELISRAVSAVEHLGCTDDAKEFLTRSLEGTSAGIGAAPMQSNSEDELARMVMTSTHPDYVEAFSLYLMGRENEQTDTQRAAVARMSPIQRAMSAGTDGTGGYFVPTHIDPGVILTSAGVANPFVMQGSVIPTTSDVLRGVQSGNAAWSWDGENVEVSDDTTTLTNTDITTHVAQGYIPISLSGLQSIRSAPDHISKLLFGGYKDLVSAATTLGSGSSQPFGIVTAAAANTPVTSATADTFAIADVYALHEANGPAFRDKASWASNISIMNLMRQFDTSGGAGMIAKLSDGTPDRVIGRPWYEASGMDGTINAAATNNVLLFGDFKAYWIAMGIGMTVKHVPMTVGSTGRPNGGEGWFAYTRFGADIANDSAIDLLDVT